MSLNDANWDWAAVRTRSEALFGSPHRLRMALLASIAADDELYAGRLAPAAGIDRKEARREVADFEAAGLLVAAGEPPGPRKRGRQPQMLTRDDNEAWAALQILGERFRRPAPTRSSRSGG